MEDKELENQPLSEEEIFKRTGEIIRDMMRSQYPDLRDIFTVGKIEERENTC